MKKASEATPTKVSKTTTAIHDVEEGSDDCVSGLDPALWDWEGTATEELEAVGLGEGEVVEFDGGSNDELVFGNNDGHCDVDPPA
jgi:hypothetical protein